MKFVITLLIVVVILMSVVWATAYDAEAERLLNGGRPPVQHTHGVRKDALLKMPNGDLVPVKEVYQR
jgi:hypothetical protein